jgi:hypothetical protein
VDKLNWKILAIVILAAGLAIGFLGGKFSATGQFNQLTGQVVALEEELKITDNLKNQLAESKAQLEKLNVNELYGLIKIGDEAKAYKIGDLNKMPPLLAQDKVGSKEVIVSWCPLCGTLTAYERVVDGKKLTFKVEGAKKLAGTDIENLHFRDEQTSSLWAQGPGTAVEGELKGKELKSVSVQMFNKDVIDKMGVPIWKP